MLGTNGGGFFNANSAHPFENPTPLTNFLQMLSIFLIPAGLCITLGQMVKSPKHGWAVLAAMVVLWFAGTFTTYWAESHGNPAFHDVDSRSDPELRPAATWRARRCASASPTPPCSPP